MTYLETINKVLRRLREDEVASPDTSAYSKLIGEFVNDANRLVEDAWDWSELRTLAPLTVNENSVVWNVTGLTNMDKILEVYNVTDKSLVSLGTQDGLYESQYLGENPKSVPSNYVLTGFTDTSASVQFYPPADKTYQLIFRFVGRTPELVNSSDVVKVPTAAVIQFAQAMAAEERGETGGTSASKLYTIAQSSLSDAIAMDAARFPTETIWYSV